MERERERERERKIEKDRERRIRIDLRALKCERKLERRIGSYQEL